MKKAIHQQDVSIKAPSRQMWRRSLLILAAVCLCFGAVGGKLAVIQIGDSAYTYTAFSQYGHLRRQCDARGRSAGGEMPRL